MYAVIFRADIRELDEDYVALAARMRERAMTEYGCIEFQSCMEGKSEIAISYWESLDQISRWKEDLEHQAAQELGRTQWYGSYTVEVVEVLRAYNRAGVKL
jgi:heme-degrading monooxygenase HmoA